MRTSLHQIFGLLAGLAVTAQASADIDYRIVTGATTGTYYAIGQNLAQMVAPAASIDLEVVPTKGSVQNIYDMRHTEKVKFALAQSDVYQAYIDLARDGDKEANDLIKPLRVILPLYFEEMHFVVPADSPLQSIHEIKDRKIYMGPDGSGANATVRTLYRSMFGTSPTRVADPPGAGDAAQAYKLALNKLLDRSGEIEVVVFVAGQPVAQLDVDADIGSKAYRLLSFQADHPSVQQARSVYYETRITPTNYRWLKQDVPTLGVKTYLITYDYQQEVDRKAIGDFAKSLCSNYNQLLQSGHKKWQQVSWSPANPSLEPLKAGWQYYSVTQPILSSCRGGVAPGGSRSSCSENRRALGLCQ